MKRKNFNLDAHCIDWLDTFDARMGEHGKSEMVRCGVTLASALESESSTEFLCDLAGLIRKGRTDEALDALHNKLMHSNGYGSAETDVGGGGSAPGADVGDSGDPGGGALPAVPRVEGNEELEGASEESRTAPTGSASGQEGEDSRASGGDSDGQRGGLGNGLVSKSARTIADLLK